MDNTIVNNILVRQNGVLHLDIRKNEIKTIIYQRILSFNFDDIQKYKFNLEFLSIIMNLIENLVDKKSNIDKKELLIEIMNHYFQDLTSDEINIILINSKFLIESNQVKKLSYYKLFKTCVKEWFFTSKKTK